MSNKTLHILNGDALRQRNLPISKSDEVVSWREMLCEGPCSPDFASKKFWKERAAYYQSTYAISPQEFESKTITEIERILPVKRFQEINLWFEYDLFCQFNMMACLAWLSQFSLKDPNVYLIYPCNEHGDRVKITFGFINDEMLTLSYKNRFLVNESDFLVAEDFWRSYCNPDPRAMEFALADLSPAFPFLAESVKNHFLRFPEKENGLGLLEKDMLTQARDANKSKLEILRSMMEAHDEFGYGDMQYFKMMDYLEDLLEQKNGVTQLNSHGLEILQGEKSLINVMKRKTYLGGALKEEFYRQNDDDSTLNLI